MWKKKIASLFLACVMLLSVLPVPVRAEDPAYALIPISDGEYCLSIDKDPYFMTASLLAEVQSSWDEIVAVRIGANVRYLSEAGSNPFSVLPSLAAFEVEDGNAYYTAVNGVLFTLFNSSISQLTYYPPAKTTPLTLPDTTSYISAAAFDNVTQAEINVPDGLELDTSSPITITSLESSPHVTVHTIPASDVESVTLQLDGASFSELPTLDPGDTLALSASVEPADALSDVTWESSNESVAAVTASGSVTAIGEGEAVITATTVGLKDMTPLSVSCTVQVRPQVTSVAITSETGRTALVPQETLTLSASAAPEGANQALSWSVSDTNVLSLSADTGSSVTVTALSAGSASVTAVSTRYGTIQDTYDITVSTPVAEITLDTDDFTLNLTNPVSQSRQLTATVSPEDATDQRISWSSSDAAVATVSPTGLVSAVSKGSATITAVSEDGGKTASCVVTVQEVDVAGLTITPSTLNLRIAPSLPTARYGQLTVSFEPDCATHQDVTWSSLNPNIATVDQSGKVTAVNNGEAYIIAISSHGTDGDSVTAQCKVTVELGVTSITIPEELELSLNKEGAASRAALSATVTPANSTDAFSWTSSNESVATVDQNGGVTAVGEGVATVTATCGSVKATCTVTVTDYQVKSFDTPPRSVEVKVGKSDTLSAKLGPAHAIDKTIVWAIDDAAVASLGQAELASDGTSTVAVQGLKVGTATVTARSLDNDSVVATCTVTVPEVKVDSLALNRTTLKLYRNSPDGKADDFPPSGTLTLTVSPADTTNDVVWTNSNDGVVALGSAQYQTSNNVKTGAVTLTAVDGGTSVITATADGQAVQCTVTVAVLAANITLNKSELDLVKGTSAALIPTVLPENVDNRAVTWTSSNEAVATVDASGMVTAVATSGTATITATAKDGSGVQASCTVTAKPVPVSGIVISPASIALEKGDAASLTASVMPASATNRSVTWASADSSIAAVDESGNVTAVNGGTTTITATTADGSYTADCEVTVTVALTGLALNYSTLTIRRAENSANTGTLIATVAPADTTAGSILWFSSDPNTVSVQSSSAIDKTTGEASVTLEGKKAGSATVTAWLGNLSRACTVTVEQPAGSVTLDRDSLALSLHKTGAASQDTLVAAAAPSDCTDRLEWSSNNESVATVDENGVVTAISAGTAIIKASAGDVNDTCAVTVTDYQIRTLSMDSELTVYLNGNGDYPAQQTLTLSIEPFDTEDVISWRSGNPDAVTLGTPEYSTVGSSKTGTVKITAAGAGKAVITAVAPNGTAAHCTVTVIVLAEAVALDRSVVTLEQAEQTTLKATVSPAAVNRSAVTWTSSDESVAVVNDGVVTAVARGTATITATAVDGSGKYAACAVTVNDISVKDVRVTPKRLTLQEGNTSDVLGASVTPSTAANKSVTWSSNSDCVTVDPSTGAITAVSVGEAEITVTTADGGLTDVCYVTVTPTPVETIVLSKSSLDVFFRNVEDRTQTLTATIEPDHATNKNLSWTSSDESVATVVGNNGTAALTLHKAGTAVITARSVSNPDISATCSVTVRTTSVAGVSLNTALLELDPADDAQLTATLTSDTENVAPDNSAVSWSSSNTSVATVDSSGKVHAVAAGTAVITVRTADQGLTATCVVRVWQKVTGVSLNTTALDLDIGDSYTLTATVNPSNAANKAVTWESDAPAVAAVDAAGNVEALSDGVAHIKVTTEDQGKSATCTITVSSVAVSSVALNETSLTLLVNDVRTLSASISPDNATNKTLDWESDQPGIVSVAGGRITAIAAGTATITAKADGKTATCSVTVYAAVTGVSISGSGILALNVGDDETLTATVAPVNEADSHVTWSSSNTNVVTVDDGGKVSAVASGTAVITATSVANPSKQAFRTVKVAQPVESVTLSADSLVFDLSAENRSSVLTAAISPSNTTDSVTWTVADSTIAQISAPSTASGSSTVTVYALKAGSTTVTVTCGNQAQTCDITVTNPVTKPVTGVSIAEPASAIELNMGDTLTLHATVSPDDATNQSVTWVSSNPAVAAVVAGIITPIAPGTASIVVTTADGEYHDSRTVTVKQLATGITLTPAVLSLPVGATEALSADLLGNPTNPNVDWSVSGNAVSVNDSGVVTALAAGTATVIAAAADRSGVSKSCTVTVYEPVSDVSIRKGGDPVSSLALNMVTETAAQLSAVTTGGSNVSLVWSSSNESVATVDATGLVSVVGAGTAVIRVTATTGDVSVSASCNVTVRKAVLSTDTTSMTLTPISNAANAVFTPWASGTSLTWSVSGSSITRTEGALSDSDKTYTISSLSNGVTTVSWAKAEDARYEASSGEITVYSLYNPITEVAVDRSKLETGCELTASLDQANRTVRVAGYVNAAPSEYSLLGKLIFTPASGVIDGLSAMYDAEAGTVVAKLGDSTICTYTLDRSGIVSLPANVKVKTTLIAEANTAVSEVNLTNADISGIESAVSAARSDAGDNIREGADVVVEVSLVPVSQTVDKIAGYNTVTLDITPQYTVSENGAFVCNGTLSELPAAVTIRVETSFRPTLIVHKHEDSIEYITPVCSSEPNANGLYTVSWQQRTFSEVSLMDEAAAQRFLAEQANADKPAEEPTKPTSGGGVSGGAPAAPVSAQPASAEPAPGAFADVPVSHWAAEAIAYASARGIMNGTGGDIFAPEAAASRAMIAQILFNLTPGKTAGTQGFADAAGTWYAEAAGWAASCGIVTGIDGSFRGNDTITREQLVTMLHRYAKFMGRELSAEASDYDRFTDTATVSPWAREAMRWAVDSGLIQGIGNTLSPSAGATRAQIAAIMMRFCEAAAV